MIKSFHIHKRNTSDIFENVPHSKQSMEKYSNKKKSNPHKLKSKTMSLVEKSGNKAGRHRIVIQNLNDAENKNLDYPFFAFGRRESNSKNWSTGIDKIMEVQDSNSRREITSHRSQKQMKKNECAKERESEHASTIEENHRKLAKSHNSKKSKPKSKKSKKDKTRSTISLSRVKSSDQKDAKTQKIERSIKMLWQCMGQLWENSRVSQYRSQKNNESINIMKRKLEEHEQKMLEIKFEIQKAEKKNVGLRS